VLLCFTGDHCSSPLLQHGYLLCHVAVLCLLPIITPSAILLLHEDGFFAVTAPSLVYRNPQAAAAICQHYQVSSILLCWAAIAVLLYRSEQRRRAVFLGRQRGWQRGWQAAGQAPEGEQGVLTGGAAVIEAGAPFAASLSAGPAAAGQVGDSLRRSLPLS